MAIKYVASEFGVPRSAPKRAEEIVTVRPAEVPPRLAPPSDAVVVRYKTRLMGIRVPVDVLDAWRSLGRGYQKRINELLRREMPRG